MLYDKINELYVLEVKNSNGIINTAPDMIVYQKNKCQYAGYFQWKTQNFLIGEN